MNAVIEEIYRTGKVEAADGTVQDASPTSVSRAEGQTLYALARKNQSHEVLEVGMAFGLSSLFICDALKENGGGRLTSIDPYQHGHFSGIGLRNITKAGYGDMHRFLDRASYLELPRLLESGERFDMAFIDGNHRYEYTLVDFFYALRMLNVDGWLILHDPCMPSVRKVVAFLLRNYADSIVLNKEYTVVPSIGQRARSLIGHLRSAPYDIFSARHFATVQHPNYVIFQKTHEFTPQDFDNAWDYYRSF